MRKYFKITQGAISVFLAIIIIPIVTLTSVFVDSGKLVLARSLAEAAGDLSLNTLLTNYDKELNEYFGLIASAQNMDDAVTIAEDFFINSMISAATDKEYKSGALYQLGKLNGAEYADFLGLSSDVIDIKPLENGSLANPALMKKQMVEFMKYRGPINAISEFCKFLFKTDWNKQMDELDEVSDMTDKKNKFYEEESTLMGLLKELRDKLKLYDGLGIKEGYINDFTALTKDGGELNNFYKKVHTKIIYDYFNILNSNGSNPRPMATYSGLPQSASGTAPTIKVIYNIGEEQKTDSSFPDIEKAFSQCAEAICNYFNKEASFLSLLRTAGLTDSNGNDIYNNSTKSSIWDVQYWAYADDTLSDNKPEVYNFTDAVNNVLVKIDALSKCLQAYNPKPEEAKHAYADKYNKNTDLEREKFDLSQYRYNYNGQQPSLGGKLDYSEQTEYLKQTVNDQVKKSKGWLLYNAIRQRINNISENSYHSSEGTTDSVPEKNKSVKYSIVNTKIKAYYDDLNGYKNTFTQAYSYMEQAIDLITQIKEQLDNYNSTFDSWDGAADNLHRKGSTADVVETDLNEISQKKGGTGNGRDLDQNDALLNKITNEDLNQLSTRLSNMKTLFGNAISGIENCKYCGKSIADISSINDAIAAADSAGANCKKFYVNDLSQKEQTFKYNPVNENDVKVSDGNNPDMSKNEPNLRKELYAFFRNQEAKMDGKYSDESANNKKDTFENQGKKDGDFDTSASSDCEDKEFSDLGDLPSKDSNIAADIDSTKTSKLEELTTIVKNMFTDFSGSVVEARDDLLVSDYIMSMFSYDTFGNELLLKCAVDKKDAPSDKADWSDKKSTYQTEFNDNKDVTYWKYNKNLRNIPIDPSTCYSYGNEIEYILYGGSNSDNKTAAYCRIYAIRFVTDLYGVFSNWWDDAAVESIAVSISAATWGVLPVSLIKLLICLALTAVEAGMDLSYIKAGFGVKFFKTKKEELFCAFSGDDVGSGDGSGKNGVGFGIAEGYLQYSHYLRLFLYLKLITPSSEKSVLQRTGDVIQANMIERNSSFKLVNSICYYRIDATISVKPLMLAIPINASETNPFSDGTKLTDFKYSMTRGY